MCISTTCNPLKLLRKTSNFSDLVIWVPKSHLHSKSSTNVTPKIPFRLTSTNSTINSSKFDPKFQNKSNAHENLNSINRVVKSQLILNQVRMSNHVEIEPPNMPHLLICLHFDTLDKRQGQAPDTIACIIDF